MKKLIAALSLCVAPFAQADVLYTYTGEKFNNFDYESSSGPYSGNFFTTDDFLQVEIFLSDYLPAQSRLFFGANLADSYFYSPISSKIVRPLSWHIKAGPLEYSSGLGLNFSLDTDIYGNIASWNLRAVDQFSYSPFSEGTINTGADTYIFSAYTPGSLLNEFVVSCMGNAKCLADRGFPEGNSNTPGTWSVQAVPEPSSYSLLAAGLVIAGFAMRRKQSVR